MSSAPDDPRSPLARTEALAEGDVPPPPPFTEAAPRIEHYVVIDELGQGGFGRVYRAYDTHLERFVALKIVHVAAAGSDEDAADLRARALREAKTLAQLDHPNVVPIFAAGNVGDDVYIAMALVTGETLARWLESPRSPREILATFIAAGRGLEAAHRTGIVHRDFKPSNVIVGADGSVRVLDFGLARAVGEDHAPETPSSPAPSPERMFVTRSGLFFGTPLFMAPEQHLGKPVDARTDQFSFCVALYVALTGEHPFGGTNLLELSRAVLDGRVRPFPARARVPAYVQRAVVRGLSGDRERRFETMGDLLAALERDPFRRYRRALVGAAIVAPVIVASVWAGRHVVAGPPACNGRPRVEGIWDDGARSTVRATFAATGRSHAADTFDRVSRRLDEYLAGLADMGTQVCQDGRRGAIPPAQARERERCLDDRAREARTLVDAFEHAADAAVVDKAIGATARLTDVRECRAPDRSLTHVALPDDPELAARVSGVVDRATRARVRSNLGATVTDETSACLDEARKTQYAPLVASMAFAHGAAEADALQFDAAERAYDEALRESARARWSTGWFGAIGAMASTRAQAHERDQLPTYVPILESLADMEADDPDMQGFAFWDLTTVERELGHQDRALKYALRAADLLDPLGGRDHLTAMYVRSIASEMLTSAGRWIDARDILARLVPQLEAEYGPHHPRLAYALWNRAMVASNTWETALGHADAARARAIYADTYGPDGLQVADALEVDAILFDVEGRPADALPPLEKARAIRLREIGPDHPNSGTIAANLMTAYLLAGDLARAEVEGARSVAIFRKAYVKDHPDLDSVLEIDAATKIRVGKLADAESELHQALTERRAQGADGVLLAQTLTELGETAMLRGHVAEAKRLAAEALADLEGKQPSPSEVAEARLVDADAALASGDAAAAIATLTRAEEVLAPVTRPDHYLRARVGLRLADALLAAGRARDALATYDAVIAALGPQALDPRDLLAARFGRARARWELDDGRDDAHAEAAEVARLAAPKELALADLAARAAAWARSHAR